MAAKGKSQEQGKYLLASHSGQGPRVYERRSEGAATSLVLQPNLETPVDPLWLEVVSFSRDVQTGVVTLRRDDELPSAELPDISPEYKATIGDPLQIQMAKRFALEDLSPQLRDALNVHERIGPGGVPYSNSQVTLAYLQRTHRVVLTAAIDLANRVGRRDRVEVIRATLAAIEAM